MMNKTNLFDNIKIDSIDPEKSSFWLLLSALGLFVIWVVFITFYLSRIVGIFVSFLLNRYLRWTKTPGHVSVGSFSLSFLGGKLMFRELVYANDDYSIRCNDGWVIFSYWKFVPGKKLSFKDTASRLHLSLNGFQIHIYNRTHRYKEIAKLFGMEKMFGDDCATVKKPATDVKTSAVNWVMWALVGVIRLDIWSGRCVVGNKSLPYLFDGSWENMTSKIRLQESANDCALLAVESQLESLKCSFLKHPEYDGKPYKDPPRTMGDGFAVLQTAHLEVYYNQDILGYETADEQSPTDRRPLWESSWRFGPNTVVSYGPWAEQQRALIYAFFFPPDYQTAPVDELPRRGQQRIQIMHDVRVVFLKESSIDLWFMRADQLESIHNRCQPGSTIDMSIWWITREDGFSWSASFSLMQVVSTTSLLYRKLFSCETLHVDTHFHYPRVFNAKQTWTFTYKISKATAWFVWDHKRFFTDLINEWSGDAPADLLSFVPYTVSTEVQVTDGFEIILLLNESNWVDPAETQSENVECAIVGEKMNFAFTLPFTDFLPETLSVKYSLLGQKEMALRMKYPPNSSTAPLLASLWQAARTNTNASPSPHGVVSKQDGWYEMWRTERISAVFDHMYHPIVAEFKPLLPFGVLQQWLPHKVAHPMELPADTLDCNIDIEGSELQLTGLLIKFIIELKNNYFGYYDSMTDIHSASAANQPGTVHSSVFNRVPTTAPAELFRPMDVTFELRVHNLRAQCLIYSPIGHEPCPVLYTEELAVQIKKSYKETFIQVGVGQCAAHFERAGSNQSDGFLSLSGLQFRGHAMFSPLDVPWDMAILEYGWIMEIIVGDISGSLEFPSHISALHQVLETLLLMALSKDDEKIVPERFNICQHGQLVSACTYSTDPKGTCESEERLKYRQLRVSVDNIRLALCDEKTIVNVAVDPLRFTLCNAHEGRFTEHICLRIPRIHIRQVLHHQDLSVWLEVAKVTVTGVSLNIELPLPEDGAHLEVARRAFIRRHDQSTRRLHFVWNEAGVWSCPCFGDTSFFGSVDTTGMLFLNNEHLQQKLFVPSISASGQPGVMQDLLRPGVKMLLDGPHMIYPSLRKSSTQSTTVISGMPSMDTGSFHSALSQQKDTRPSSCRALMGFYGSYLSQVEVIKPNTEPPRFGDPGSILHWAHNKIVHLNTTTEGLNDLRMKASPSAEGARHPKDCEKEAASSRTGAVHAHRLVIQGSVANSIDVFVSPLSIESMERLLHSITAFFPRLSPAFLTQMTYRDCVLRNHRQPLTEALFSTSPVEPSIELNLELPRLHLAMFQNGLMDHIGSHPLPPSQSESDRQSAISSNMAFIVLDGANLSSASANETANQGSSFIVHCSVLSSQLVQFTSKKEGDFAEVKGSRTPYRSMVDWGSSKVASRIQDREPRVVVDFQIPDVLLTLDRQQTAVYRNANTTAEVRKSDPLLQKTQEASAPNHINNMKIEVGTVRMLVVMARPLERTGRDEFPIYDVISPAITAWLNVAQRLDYAVEKMKESWSAWSDMSFARVMKLALDCTDDQLIGGVGGGQMGGAKGKNLMETVKVLGKHQASCPTCLLLNIFMRWYSLPSSAQAVSSPLIIKSAFLNNKTRKTALMALLSHWHPDICQMVKLASNDEASKYRVDPAQKKAETRINIDPPESRHRRNGSAASRNLSRDGVIVNGTQQVKRPSEVEPKSDLYRWILSAHRERNERKEKRALDAAAAKDYVNPMDILPQAFFYSFYRVRRLDWTQLDGVPLNNLQINYELLVKGMALDLIEPKLVVTESSTVRLLQKVHNLMTVKLLKVSGDLSWSVEMDDKGLLPIRGNANLKYQGQVQDVQLAAALSSVCLGKEMVLVVKTAVETLVELRKQKDRETEEQPMLTPVSANSSVTANSGDFEPAWEERLLEMMRDFEKNAQRTGHAQRGDVLTCVRGHMIVDDVKFESWLTELYVCFDMKTIEMTQEHNPGSRSIPHDVDVLRLALRKAKLSIREAVSDNIGRTPTNDSKPIIHCGLKESSATLVRKVLIVEGQPAKLDTSLSVVLGAIEGELPMAAHSLHDVVMRHGPQLEQQFNRLSSQPQATTSTPAAETTTVTLPTMDTTDWKAGGSAERTRHLASRADTPIAKVSFMIHVNSIELKARLLPSLKAMYRMKQAVSTGVTGAAANWTVSVEDHHAEFEVTPPDKPADSFVLALPAVTVNGQYLAEDMDKAAGGSAPATDKQLHYRQGGYLKMVVTLGQVNHSFTTELLNHILFAEQSFRSELSSLVQRLNRERTVPDYSSPSSNVPAILSPTQSTTTNSGPHPADQSTSPSPRQPAASSPKTPLLFFLTVKGTGVPWLQLTAATPSSTAVRFTIESLETELTNRWVVKEEGSTRERLFGAAVIQFNAKLGQLVKPAQYEEIQAELQEYATFMTQIRVENKEGSKQTSYSYHISLNRPILLLKSSAIDKAILLWLNYKNTYDYWRAERTRFERQASNKRHNSISQAMFSPQPSQDFDINLSLAINNGMYVCMPLISHDVTEGMPALVLSLQKSDVTVTIKKELACQAHFHGFKLNFIDNFDEQSLSQFADEPSMAPNYGAAATDVPSNYFFFPQGSYKLCSKASNDSGDARWVLSVRAHMRGMIIDLDQRIGKLAKMLVNTISSLGEDDEDYADETHFDPVHDLDEDLVDGASELQKLQPEGRVPWMERKMHEQSQLVSDLMARKVGEKQLETERRKLRQYELIRFKEFRRSMMEKLRRKNDRKDGKRPSTTSENVPPVVPARVALTRTESDADSTRGGGAGKTGQQDTVNMHIDVQVSIESGTCTLRSAPKSSSSADSTGLSAPIGVSALPKRASAKDLRAKPIQSTNYTKFSIPSVDLKGYFVSTGELPPGYQATGSNSNFHSASNEFHQHHAGSFGSGGGASADRLSVNRESVRTHPKRGCFYLSVALSSMPTETVVTPHLADYLEQVLEPLPVSVGGIRSASSMQSLGDTQDGMNNMVAIDTSILPLDVILYLTVQSSTIRFDGQQQRSSAADCLLKLPRLTLMASTRKTDGAEYVGGVDISVTLSAFSLSIFSPHQQSTAHDALSLSLDHLSLVISRSKNASSESDNKVRFVLTSNIGTALFIYDMRRLSELLEFPKPWYRRAIARRVFFGDQAAPAGGGTAGQGGAFDHSRTSTLNSQPDFKAGSSIAMVTEKPWSATVLVALQWKELRVEAQMSNTMGTCLWMARQGLLRAYAKLNSRQERDITLTFRLESSELTAHGGAISGEIALNRLALTATHKRLSRQPPRNKAQVELGWLMSRVEWMSRAVLIGKCERPSITMGDEFIEEKDKDGEVTKASVSLNVKGAWDDLQVVITRNTINDFQKIVAKLNTFFLEQLKSSQMVWRFAEEGGGVTSSQNQNKEDSDDMSDETTPSATHIWEKVLDVVTDMQYSLQLLGLPRSGDTVVGGSVELEAGRLSLACMHGEMNAPTWAVFHMRQPSILFSPEAHFSYLDKEAGKIGVSVRQRLIIRLGPVSSHGELVNTENMANVCRVQQNRNSMMRQNAPIGSSLEYLIGDVLKQIGLTSNTQAGPVTTKSQHNVLQLFQFPALEAVLTSLQCNECDPEEENMAPDLHSSFVCEFHNHVYVQTDFNAQVSFLPELLKSYIHVQDGPPTAPSGTNVAAANAPSSSSSDDRPSKADRRVYKCDNWVVDPKIRFIDRFKWNPPVIDEVLRKLQIFDHRTTIPKALQRALLDPLDVSLAVALLQMLKLVERHNRSEKE